KTLRHTVFMPLSNDGHQKGRPFSCLIFDPTDSESGLQAWFQRFSAQKMLSRWVTARSYRWVRVAPALIMPA
ncbi:MAG: hypothetical protein Q8L38_01370, partial [Pseudohongiella sp.]|nr:hypothetical protein [Pseudohongiella sp.]